MLVEKVGMTHFIYSPDLIDDIFAPELFDYGVDKDSSNTAIGRGEAVFFELNGLSLVRKHYQRGGFVARLLHDQYFGQKLETSRAFLEWKLLEKMQSLGLPSPIPVAARVIKNGLFYQADMVMMAIPDTETLADRCFEGSVSGQIWFDVGQCIKQFHDYDVYHADLNARNVLINAENNVFLIDFDKSYMRADSVTWKVSNLSRLKRSLNKFQSSSEIFHFSESNWDELMNGYNQNC